MDNTTAGLSKEGQEAVAFAKKKAAADAQLASAYKRIYGTDGKRDQAQTLVWNSMMNTLSMPNNYVVQPNGQVTLIQDPKEAELNEGARTYIWNLKRLVESPNRKHDNHTEQ